MVQEPQTPTGYMLVFDFWVVGVSFSFCGHDTDTYRTVSAGHGAFELCLPSLGFLFTKLTLRSQLLGQAYRMTKVPDGRDISSLQHDAVGTLFLWSEVSVLDVLRHSQ